MKKFLWTLLTSADEDAFERELRVSTPGLRIVDGNRWPTPEPPLAHSISSASESYVFLWDPAVADRLPSIQRSDGVTWQGPSNAVVVQFERSRMKDGCLLAGSISVGFNDPSPLMADFVKRMLKALNKVSSNKITTAGLETTAPPAGLHAHRAGLDAIIWCKADASRYFSNGGTSRLVPY